MKPSSDPVRALRYCWRVPVLLLHVFLGLPVTLLMINPLTARWRIAGERVDHRVIRLWSGGLMRIFGFRLRRFGQPLREAHLAAANHVAWIDIELVHSQRVVGFVAKSEISHWPLVGWMASRAGTIYHRRGDTRSLASVMEKMVLRLQQGEAVGVFPEGRTTSGAGLGTFHARIFQAAFEAGVPVQPVALRYGEHGLGQQRVAFAAGENFATNFLRLLGEPGQVAEVHFLPPVMPDERGRRALADEVRKAIGDVMAS